MIKKYQDHASILKIKENVKPERRFDFQDVDEDQMFKKIIKLDPSKASMKNDIPAKLCNE